MGPAGKKPEKGKVFPPLFPLKFPGDLVNQPMGLFWALAKEMGQSLGPKPHQAGFRKGKAHQRKELKGPIRDPGFLTTKGTPRRPGPEQRVLKFRKGLIFQMVVCQNPLKW